MADERADKGPHRILQDLASPEPVADPIACKRDDAEALIDTLEQTDMELALAVERENNWYTDGAAGKSAHVRHNFRRAKEAREALRARLAEADALRAKVARAEAALRDYKATMRALGVDVSFEYVEGIAVAENWRNERAEAAEAENARYKAALEKISANSKDETDPDLSSEDSYGNSGDVFWDGMRQADFHTATIARNALKGAPDA
jgi:hypothetical protein